MSFYRYLDELDVHVVDCSGQVDEAIGMARLKALEQALGAHAVQGGQRRLLIDFRNAIWANEQVHRRLATVTRRDFGLGSEDTTLRAAILDSRRSGPVSRNEHWFCSEAEALAWLCAGSRSPGGPVPIQVDTPRLRLVVGTLPLAEAELAGNAPLAALLGAEVPASWPPESLRPALPLFLARSKQTGCFAPWCLGWYGVLRAEAGDILCGSVGFKGVPTLAGMVELGYSVLPSHQRRGVATEMVTFAARWAIAQPAVGAVEAEALKANVASARVLAKAGFVAQGAGAEPGTQRYRLV
jgi:[ribosomal protein S5]-alanine N-acetyltransferase